MLHYVYLLQFIQAVHILVPISSNLLYFWVKKQPLQHTGQDNCASFYSVIRWITANPVQVQKAFSQIVADPPNSFLPIQIRLITAAVGFCGLFVCILFSPFPIIRFSGNRFLLNRTASVLRHNQHYVAFQSHQYFLITHFIISSCHIQSQYGTKLRKQPNHIIEMQHKKMPFEAFSKNQS